MKRKKTIRGWFELGTMRQEFSRSPLLFLEQLTHCLVETRHREL